MLSVLQVLFLWLLVLIAIVNPSAIAFTLKSLLSTTTRSSSCGGIGSIAGSNGPTSWHYLLKAANGDDDDISDFFRQALGDSGATFTFSGIDGNIGGDGGGGGGGNDDSASAAAAQDSLEALMSFDLKPKEVVEYLNRFVIQQDDAKKVLAVAICDHYNHCRRCLQKNDNDNKDSWSLLKEELSGESSSSSEYAKPNILLAGPTGVGKTYLLKCLARLVGVPFVKADATKFSETGIVGRDAEDLVRDLVDKANGNTTLAGVGIIYLDEVDKIAGGGDNERHMRGSFNTRGVQNNFLKLLEDTEVNLERQSDIGIISNLPFMGGGPQKPKTISTKNILFIFSGAFTNLDSDIRRKKEKKPFGLDTSRSGQTANSRQPNVPPNINAGDETKPRSYLRFAETSDFISAGLEPEFVGRVPVRVALDALDANDLKQILVGAEGSVLKQFVRDMEGYNINMTASDDALNEIARQAEKEGTGARGLVTILERTLRQHKFELPSTSVAEFVLDKETVLNPDFGLQRLMAATTPDDDMAVLLRDLKRWEAKLNRQLPDSADAWLTDDAVNYMILKSLEGDEMSAYSFADRHFGDGMLAAVIKRVHDATSQKLFPITIDVAKNPKVELQKWLDLVKESSSE